MPGMHVALSFLNKIFGDPALLQQHRVDLLDFYRPTDNPDEALDRLVGTVEQLLSGEGLLDEAVQGADPSTIASLMRGLPPTVAEAGRAIIYRNVQRDEPFGMTFAWAPAYDSELTVWESPPTDISPGWITVVIKGRYPDDPHPVTGKGLTQQWG